MDLKRKNFIFLLVLIVLASGCITPSEELEGDVEVKVGEMYFEQVDSDLPENVLEAEIGNEIVFHNEGSIAHTVTIEELNFDEHLNSGEKVSLTVEENLDEVIVDCTLHENHDATLTVS